MNSRTITKYLLCVFALCVLGLGNASAQSKFWIGGTGNWSDVAHWSNTSGGASCACVPATTDDVIFDANSFATNGQTVTMDATANCNSMDWSAITKTVILSGGFELHVNGSFTLSTLLNVNTYTGPLYFESVNAGNTVTTSGKTLQSSIAFTGTGDWTLQDAFITTNGISLDFGTLTTNNKNLTCYSFTSNTSNLRGLTLGSSTVTVTYNSWNTGGPNFAFDAGTSLIHFPAASTALYLSAGTTEIFYDVLFQSNTSPGNLTGGAYFRNVTFSSAPGTISASNGATIHKALFNGDGTINSNTTFDSLLFSPGYVYTLGANSTQTINNILKADGTCTQLARIQSANSGTQASISKAAGAVTLNYVSLKDINATGGASFTANNGTDFGNNTGWTINTPAAQTLYWVGGSGNWNNPARWSTTSGGAGGTCIPGIYDNVIFDANSFTANQIVTVNVPAYCKNMNWAAITFAPQLTGTPAIYIYGSLTLSSLMNVTNYTGQLNFNSDNLGNTITSAGKTIQCPVFFNGTGDWTLQDAFNTTVDITLNFGTLTTNNKNITCSAFTSNNNNVRALTLGTSTVTITGYYGWNTGGSNYTFDAGTSLIQLTFASSSIYLSAGAAEVFYNVLFQNNTSSGSVNGGASFHNVTFSAGGGTLNSPGGVSYHIVTFNGNGTVNYSYIIDSLIFSSGYTYALGSSTTQTINNYFKADGTCSQPITIQSTSAGTQGSVSKSAGTVTLNYVSLKDMNATGGAVFTANNSSDFGNNTGWAFSNSPQTLYWIGGTGNWNSPAHWSTSSGGSAGTCIPAMYDNVVFDANSFSGNGQIVTVNVIAYCKNMDWSGITKLPLLSGTSDLHIHGTLMLSSLLSILNYTGQVNFDSNVPGNTITSAGRLFQSIINFNGVGEWKLQDAFATTSAINLNFGSLSTINNNLTCGNFTSSNNNPRWLTLGSSAVTLSSTWITSGNNFTFDAGTSTIILAGSYLSAGTTESFYDVVFQNTNTYSTIYGGTYFHDVTFNHATSSTINASNGITMHKVIFNGDGAINNNYSYDTLIFSAGYDFMLANTTVQTINNYFKAEGTCSQTISIASNSAGTQATISKASGNVTLNYVSLMDIKGMGGATFTASNSINLGNNTGWTINAPATITANYSHTKNGLTLTCTNTSTGSPSCYFWDFGDGNTSTLASPVHFYNVGGIYNVCLISSDCCNNKDTVCNSIGIACASAVATFTNTVSGLTATLTNSSTNASSVLWNFGDGYTSTLMNPGSHTYFGSGTYTISLIAINGCGSDTMYQTVTVTCVPPVASFTHSVNGLTINFTNTSSNAAVSSWNFGDAQSSSANSPSHVYTNPGTYTVTLTVSNACGTNNVSQSVIVVCASPSASFITNPQGLSVDFVSTSTNAATVSWNFGDGSSPSILPAVNHTYSTSGTYTVCLAASNGCGTDTFCTAVSVCTGPSAAFTYTTTALSVDFTNISTNGITYVWNFGDASATNFTSPTHIYTASGTYTVCLVASNSCGSDTTCIPVIITCTPFTQQPICAATVDSSSTYNLLVWEKPITASIDSFRIYREIASAYSPIGTIAYSALSEFKDTTAGVNPNITSYKYKVSLIDTCGNESALSTFHRTIHLAVSPAVPCGYNLFWNDYVGFTVTQYRILRDTTGTGGNYVAADSVSFGNNAWTDTTCYSPLDTVLYIIEITHPTGCTSSVKLPDVFATNLNSSKSNVYRIADTTVTGIPGVTDNFLVTIFPNPSSGLFTIDFQYPQKGILEVFNLLGERIHRTGISENQQTLDVDLSGYPKGIYHLRATQGSRVVNKKLVVR